MSLTPVRPLTWGTDGRPRSTTDNEVLNANIQEKDMFTATNKNAGTIVRGMAVYQMSTADQVDLSRADASGTKLVLGLVADASIAADAVGNFQSDGLLTGTTAEWDAVTGQTGGLVPGTEYWLDKTTAGKLSPTVPAAPCYRTLVGIAKSTTVLELNITYMGYAG